MCSQALVEIETVFADFEDYRKPFLGEQGPAPAYAISLTEEHRDALRDLLWVSLPTGPDGTIALIARAWAVRGVTRDTSAALATGPSRSSGS